VKGRTRETVFVVMAALAARVAWVAWAGRTFPAAADGLYYDRLAQRLVHGQGYTWSWPDGAITYAAHYPIGYPAMLALAYAAFGATPIVAGAVNALVGAAATGAVHRLLLAATGQKAAYLGAVVVAVHPALVPYTSAIMTEGVTAGLVVIAAALAAGVRARSLGDAERRRLRWGWLVAAGLVLGVATLVRPQCVALAPALGALALAPGAGVKARLAGAALVASLTIATCLPWTARNCVRMQRCALVSVNGGWNLLIGAQTTTGAWAEVDVPPECRTVWDEAAKDTCFERAGRRAIAAAPGAWLAAMPRKLGVTFDYFGAAPLYLHQSNAAAFREVDKLALGAVETLVSRLLLLGALLATARLAGPRGRLRAAVAVVAAAFALSLHAWPAYLALPVLVALLGRRRVAEVPLVVPWAAVVVAVTALAHAAFFGAGRYGLVTVPLVTALAFVRPSAAAARKP
jgi:4-amino-4-deoxy-L-arabinose transferase-like glycosyltransferase